MAVNKIRTYSEFLNEKNIKKGKWSKAQPKWRADELINLVKTAYKKTPEGSFINSKGDLKPSEWLSLDFNDDPKLDITIFYRGPRNSENWKGKKIQGIGHNDTPESKKAVINKLIELLGQDGVWIEASDALEKVLYKNDVNYITDESLLQGLFPNTDLTLIGPKGQYTRVVDKIKRIKETTFGKPKLKDTDK